MAQGRGALAKTCNVLPLGGTQIHRKVLNGLAETLVDKYQKHLEEAILGQDMRI